MRRILLSITASKRSEKGLNRVVASVESWGRNCLGGKMIIKQSGRAIKYIQSRGDDSFSQGLFITKSKFIANPLGSSPLSKRVLLPFQKNPPEQLTVSPKSSNGMRGLLIHHLRITLFVQPSCSFILFLILKSIYFLPRE